MSSKTIKYKFDFYFYNQYGCDFENFFLNRSRVTIHNVEANISFPAMFIEFTESNNKITGYMHVLLFKTNSLFELKGNKYLINYPYTVGHLTLLEGYEETEDL